MIDKEKIRKNLTENDIALIVDRCFHAYSSSHRIEGVNMALDIFHKLPESRDTEVKELEHDLRQYKKHVNKLMERYNIKDGRGDLIEIQHHWFKNLIEWHREATK